MRKLDFEGKRQKNPVNNGQKRVRVVEVLDSYGGDIISSEELYVSNYG